MTRLNTAVGSLLIVKTTARRTDGLVERLTMKVRITFNNGHRCEWVKVEDIHAENVLRETKEGGFSLNPQMLALMRAEGQLANFEGDE